MNTAKIQDTIQFLKKLSFSKIKNALAIYFSYYISKILSKPIVWGQPFNISIEPTTNCNLGCPECPSGLKQFSRPTGNIQEETYKNIINQLKHKLLYCYFYFQGEPYIHPQFLEIVQYAAKQNIYTVTSTNAHYLTPRKAIQTVQSGLHRLIISIDGTTQETYQQYRIGGKLQKVLDGTKNLIQAKKDLNSNTPHIIFQFLVVKPNQHQIEEAKKIAKEIGVNAIKFKTAQVYDYKNGNELIPTINKYSRYTQNKDSTWQLKNKMYNSCWKLWHSTVFTWDGTVVPCCFDKDATHQMGTIQTNTFKQIWQNKNFFQFRKNILKSRKSIEICKNCTEGTKVWID